MRSAIERGKQALALHVEGMIEDGKRCPQPRTIERLRGEEPVWLSDAILVLIELEVPGKALRVNISIDDGLVSPATA